MDKVQNAFRVCQNNFLKWRSSPRTVIVFLLLAVFMYDVTAGTRALTASQNIAVTPWLFPFIPSYSLNLDILYFSLILLFCDAPFFDEQFPYVCMRAGRFVWAIGQILYIVFASLVYTIASYLFCLLFCLPNLSFSVGWGKILRMMSIPLSKDFSETYLTGVMGNDSGINVMSLYTPLQATLFTLLLMWLIGIFLGLLMFTINLHANRGVGSLVAAFFVILNFFASIFADGHGFKAPIIYYFSPVSWANLNNLQMNASNRPPIAYALTTLCLLILIFIIVSVYSMKRKEIEVLPEI